MSNTLERLGRFAVFAISERHGVDVCSRRRVVRYRGEIINATRGDSSRAWGRSANTALVGLFRKTNVAIDGKMRWGILVSPTASTRHLAASLCFRYVIVSTTHMTGCLWWSGQSAVDQSSCVLHRAASLRPSMSAPGCGVHLVVSHLSWPHHPSQTKGKSTQKFFFFLGGGYNISDYRNCCAYAHRW